MALSGAVHKLRYYPDVWRAASSGYSFQVDSDQEDGWLQSDQNVFPVSCAYRRQGSSVLGTISTPFQGGVTLGKRTAVSGEVW